MIDRILRNTNIFQQKAYVNGEWIGAFTEKAPDKITGKTTDKTKHR